MRERERERESYGSHKLYIVAAAKEMSIIWWTGARWWSYIIIIMIWHIFLVCLLPTKLFVSTQSPSTHHTLFSSTWSNPPHSSSLQISAKRREIMAPTWFWDGTFAISSSWSEVVSIFNTFNYMVCAKRGPTLWPPFLHCSSSFVVSFFCQQRPPILSEQAAKVKALSLSLGILFKRRCFSW